MQHYIGKVVDGAHDPSLLPPPNCRHTSQSTSRHVEPFANMWIRYTGYVRGPTCAGHVLGYIFVDLLDEMRWDCGIFGIKADIGAENVRHHMPSE